MQPNIETKVSKTFCILPWIHLSTRPNGHLRVCCTANASSAGKTNDKKFGGEIGILKGNNSKPLNLGHIDLLDAWNSDYMKSTRVNMLNGKIPPQCQKCFTEEAAGHRSKRIWETENWAKKINIQKLIDNTKEDGEVPAKIYYFDLRMGTKCNLKCIMCSPHDSSLWMSDWNKLYPSIENKSLKQLAQWEEGSGNGGSYSWYEDNPTFFTQLFDQVPHMKQLYFAGGEALIMDEHYHILQEIIDRGFAHKVQLRYNSNGVSMPEKLLDLWSKFKSVRFHFSIDSIEGMNDYIRFPPTWNKIVKNLKRLDETPDNIEVTIACAVQSLNIFYIPDFIKWKIKMNFKKVNAYPLGAGLINFHLVYHPAYLNVKVLPQWFKDLTTQKYEEFYVWLKENYRNDEDFLNSGYGIKRLKGLVSFMNSDDWSNRLPEFREYISKMDAIRGTDFKKTFPEMSGVIEDKNDY